MIFKNREHAAKLLAEELKKHPLKDPLVLGIPRGGVLIAAIVARELGAELDVVLSRKLRAPNQPELALGAISEDGQVYINPDVYQFNGQFDEHIQAEIKTQMDEIRRRSALFRSVRPPAQTAGRSVIVMDDGIATGATMTAALQVLRTQTPHELIAAAPVAPPERYAEIERNCDRVICMDLPENFYSVGQFYEDFRQIEDDEVVQLLRFAARPAAAH